MLGCIWYVNPTVGVDAVGRGGEGNPFKTIAFAVSQIPPHGNSYSVWANERWTIHLQCGRYPDPGPIEFRQVRRSIRLEGAGAIVENEVRFVADIADYPDGVAFNPALVPIPWTGVFTGGIPLSCWEIDGDFAGGMEGGHPANNIILMSVTRYRAVSPQLTPIGPVFSFFHRVQGFGGFEYVNASGAALALTVELNDSSLINGRLGGDGVSGGVFSLKAHNSQLRSTLGPFVTILEIDSCRVQGVDRLTDFAGGPVAGSIVSGVVTNQAHIHNCAFNGSTYNFGQPAPGGILIMDEVSLRRLLAQPGVVFTNVTARIHDILSGTTAARPTSLVERGTRYYDTTLSVPIWREPGSGTGWVNGVGAAV